MYYIIQEDIHGQSFISCKRLISFINGLKLCLKGKFPAVKGQGSLKKLSPVCKIQNNK
jgi:hypothetical protein